MKFDRLKCRIEINFVLLYVYIKQADNKNSIESHKSNQTKAQIECVSIIMTDFDLSPCCFDDDCGQNSCVTADDLKSGLAVVQVSVDEIIKPSSPRELQINDLSIDLTSVYNGDQDRYSSANNSTLNKTKGKSRALHAKKSIKPDVAFCTSNEVNRARRLSVWNQSTHELYNNNSCSMVSLDNEPSPSVIKQADEHNEKK
jgi:hypothetical protein